MISKASDCTINQYIKCLFDNDCTVLGEGTEQEQHEAFQKIQTEYIDISGQYESKEYEIIKTITSISSRISFIETLLWIEYQTLHEFNKPYLPAFLYFKKYGYNLIWNDNTEDFKAQLVNIEFDEKKFEILLEEEKQKIKKPETNEDIPPAKRIDFIKMLVGLQKHEYKIDRNQTTVEELAIMVSELRELIITNEVNHE